MPTASGNISLERGEKSGRYWRRFGIMGTLTESARTTLRRIPAFSIAIPPRRAGTTGRGRVPADTRVDEFGRRSRVSSRFSRGPEEISSGGLLRLFRPPPLQREVQPASDAAKDAVKQGMGARSTRPDLWKTQSPIGAWMTEQAAGKGSCGSTREALLGKPLRSGRGSRTACSRGPARRLERASARSPSNARRNESRAMPPFSRARRGPESSCTSGGRRDAPRAYRRAPLLPHVSLRCVICSNHASACGLRGACTTRRIRARRGTSVI